MLSLLALFTVLAVAFVAASGQFRRGAAIAAKAEQTGDTFDLFLQQAMMQVVRGSQHPQSAIGPHSLLEDMYGQSDAVVGCVWPVIDSNETATDVSFDWIDHYQNSPQSMLLKFVGYSFGWDRQPGIAFADDDGNGVVDDVTEVFTNSGDDGYFGLSRAHPLTQAIPEPGKSPPVSASLPIVDNVDNYYAGRVITFTSGPAAGQSCYIVRSKVIAGSNGADLSKNVRTVFYITPPANGKIPNTQYGGKVVLNSTAAPDRFVINGRPFSGRGMGASPYQFDPTTGLPVSFKPSQVNSKPNPRLRMLDQPYRTSIDAANPAYGLNGKQVPIAYTPNPVDAGMRDYLNRYAPFVEMDEDYDAPDHQNMLLAYRQSVRRYAIDPRTGAPYDSYRFETIAPSLHRPDLVNYFVHNGTVNPKYSTISNPRWYHLPPSVRRRIILRPDPVDHYDYTQENVLNPIQSDGWFPGEPFTDVNQNGQWDPYVASINGAEPYTDLNKNKDYDVGDRPYYNPNFDAVDGPWDVDNDGDGSPDSIWVDLGMPVTTWSDGRLVKPLFAVMVIDLDGRINVNAHGSKNQYTASRELLEIAQPNGEWKNATAPVTTTNDFNPPLPVNLTNVTASSGWYTTEERYFIGPYGYATSQRNNANGGGAKWRTIRSPIVASGQFDIVRSTTDRWATFYQNDYPGVDIETAYRTTGTTLGAVIEPAFGQGWSPADVNVGAALLVGGGLPHLVRRSLTSIVTAANPSTPRINHYRELLEGRFRDSGNTPVMGRYGEIDLLRPQLKWAAGYGLVPSGGSGQITSTTLFKMLQDYGGIANAYGLIRDDDMPAPAGGKGSVLGNSARDAFGSFQQGDFASPGDFKSSGAVGLDLRGQPLAVGMGRPDDPVDEPTEIFLDRRYFPRAIVTTGSRQGFLGDGTNGAKPAGTQSHREAPFTPAELERILRIHDPNSLGLSSRLWTLLGDDDDRFAKLFTTESWDLPCPHIAPTPELSAALLDLGLPIGNPTIGDLLRARFYLASGRKINAIQAATLATISMRSYAYKSASPSSTDLQNNRARMISPDVALGLRMDVNAPFGNGVDDDGDDIVDEPGEKSGATIEPLNTYDLDGNLVSALNFDGNRDGNAPPPPPTSQNPPSYQREFENPRQQYAKELYCLMMLLIDENYVLPVAQRLTSVPSAPPPATTEQEPIENLPSGTPVSFAKSLFPQLSDGYQNLGTNFPAGETESRRKAKRWLTANRIAQWAINAADFRDRDSIMSPFEFDVDPFNNNDASGGTIRINNAVGTGGTWDVDGDLTTDENAINSAATSGNWFRGVVWGVEYPDLLLTETLAYHDRRTANTMFEVEVPVDDGMGGMTTISGTYKLCRASSSGGGNVITTDTDGKPYDTTWDQTRVPEGSAFIELYATGNPNNPLQAQELYTRDGQLALSRVVTGTSPDDPLKTTKFPVWRLAVSQGRVRSESGAPADTPLPQNDVALRLAQNPGSCSLDPRDAGFSILPWVNQAATTSNGVVIERVVTFCGESIAGLAVTSTYGLNMLENGSPATTLSIDVFGGVSGTVSLTTGEYAVTPGRYVVVGPHREGNLGGVSMIGRTETECLGTDTSGKFQLSTATSQQQGVLSLQAYTFAATSPNGVCEYPTHSSLTTATSTLNQLTNTNNSNSNSPTPPTYNQIQPPVSIGCAKVTSTGTPLPFTSGTIGFNISEPTSEERTSVYKQYATNGAVTLTLGTHTDNWNTTVTRSDALNSTTTGQIYDDVPWDGYFDENGDEIVNNPQLAHIEDSTTLRYKAVFLQRLADPTQPWNRLTNPYLTIDWMPFDLTVFNGEPYWLAPAGSDRTNQLQAMHQEHLREPGNFRPNRTAPPAASNDYNDESVRFGSRQRGGARYPFLGNFSHFQLWAQPNWIDRTYQGSTLPPLTNPVAKGADASKYQLGHLPANTATAASQNYLCKWQDPLRHTLGYINEPYHYQLRLGNFNPLNTLVASPQSRPAPRATPDGALPAPKGWLMGCDFSGADSPYIGSPWRPFDWLTWNNRPYSGALELMLVPAVGPSRLLYEYDMRRTTVPAGSNPNSAPASGVDYAPFDSKVAANHYLPPISAAGEPGYLVRPPFGHLLNFFESTSAAPFGQTPISFSVSGSDAQSYSAANFHRLLEFVTVPSRFSGTRRVYRNGVFNNTYNNSLFTGNEHPSWPFVAPFNLISSYREPGRVNLNTMPAMWPNPAGIWRAVTNDFHPQTPNDRGNANSGIPGFYRATDVINNNVKNSDRNLTFNGNWTYPSQNTKENFQNLFAGLHTDNPLYDPRGPNGTMRDALPPPPFDPKTNPNPPGRDDTDSMLLSDRCDPQRPSLFNNPFRSFTEDFGAVAPSIPGTVTAYKAGSQVQGPPMESYHSSLGPDYPFLAADASLLRRRDTTWTPWNTAQSYLLWPSSASLVTYARQTPGQIDSAFDPLFALNFPGPVQPQWSGIKVFSAYSMNMLYYNTGSAGVGGRTSRTTDYRNTDRNPFFRYQMYSKLSNIATTRSNVYAIWVTMGYFEVERVDYRAVLPSQEQSDYHRGDDMPMPYRYPDGYRILRELGSESGDVTRHKAFAIFDRTIPVGFLRGENLNADQGFLVRRILY